MGKKVLAITAKDKNSASCRIRFHTFLKNLPSGWSVTYNPAEKYDIVYIQKVMRDWIFQIVKRANKQSIPIVFDKDDIRRDWDKAGYDKIMSFFSAITTDTNQRAALIRKHVDIPVFVVPDCIDYGINFRIPIRKTIESAVTYGRNNGVKSVAPFFDVLPCNKSYIARQKLNIDAKFVKWHRKKFVTRIAKHDIAVLSHSKKGFGAPFKSNNRLLVAMALGMPIIATRTPSYEETLVAAKCKQLIVDCPQEALQVYNDLQKQDTRKKVGKMLYDYAHTHYAPYISGKKLSEVFECIQS